MKLRKSILIFGLLFWVISFVHPGFANQDPTELVLPDFFDYSQIECAQSRYLGGYTYYDLKNDCSDEVIIGYCIVWWSGLPSKSPFYDCYSSPSTKDPGNSGNPHGFAWKRLNPGETYRTSLPTIELLIARQNTLIISWCNIGAYEAGTCSPDPKEFWRKLGLPATARAAEEALISYWKSETQGKNIPSEKELSLGNKTTPPKGPNEAQQYPIEKSPSPQATNETAPEQEQKLTPEEALRDCKIWAQKILDKSVAKNPKMTAIQKQNNFERGLKTCMASKGLPYP